MVLADVAPGRRAPLYYGLGLGTNVAAVFLGIVLSGDLLRLASGSETLTAELAGLSVFGTLALVPALRETLQNTPALAAGRAPDSLMHRFQVAGLTRRETEVCSLLLSGASNREIEGRLAIAPDTLKTHLRNIYRKIGVRDRRGLTLIVVDELTRVIEGLETDLQERNHDPPQSS